MGKIYKNKEMGKSMKKLVALFIVLLLAGCQISDEQAEIIARAFVSKQVKFFEKGNSTTLPEVLVQIKSIEKIGPDWKVRINASTEDNKSAEVEVLVGSNGQIKTVNGNPVQKIQ